MITEALDHVRITSLLLDLIALSTFFTSLGCTNGPFLIDRDILRLLRNLYLSYLLLTMNLLDGFFFFLVL